jgi:hypothetical protein
MKSASPTGSKKQYPKRAGHPALFHFPAASGITLPDMFFAPDLGKDAC